MFGNYDNSVKIIEQVMEMYASLPMTNDERDTATNALMAARALIIKAQEDEMEEFNSHRFDGHVDAFDSNDLPY